MLAKMHSLRARTPALEIPLVCIYAMLLAVGMFMDTAPSIMIFTPILLPIVSSMNIDPVHFGIVMVVNLDISCSNPSTMVTLVPSTTVAD